MSDVPSVVIEIGCAVIVDVAGSADPTVTVRLEVSVFPLSLACTVWAPAVVALHDGPLPGHEPFGVIEKVESPVASPRELLSASNASTV